jgi:ABC-type nitrate/sulfonate/bicarbonate transport system substrate-binding protein
VLAAIAVAVLLAGAGSSAAAPRSHRAAYEIVMGVPGIPPVFLGVRPYIAWNRGFYEKFLGGAADIRIQDFTTGTAAMRAVQNGQIDLAWAPTPTVMAAMAGGANLVAIEGMDTIDWELGSIDPSISTCSTLKGQTIGVDTVGGARYNALIGMLSKCSLTINDVKTVNFPGAAGMNAQIAGQLTVNVDHVDEVAQIQAAGKKVTIAVKLTDVDPYQHYDMLLTSKDKLAQNRALYVKVIQDDIAATAWMYDPKNLDAAAKTGQITGDSLTVSKAALQHYLGIKWWNVNASGLTVQRITRTLGEYLKLGAIPPGGNALTYKTITDNTLWKDAWKAVGAKYKVSAAQLKAHQGT